MPGCTGPRDADSPDNAIGDVRAGVDVTVTEPFPSGRFRADPGAVGPLRAVRAATGLELKLLLHNGEQLLLALIIPVAALIGLRAVRVVSLPEPRIAAVLPGVLALAALSSCFTSQAITTAFDRRYGVLKRLAVAGMSRPLLLAAKVATALLVLAGQVLVLAVLAVLLGWRPTAGVAGWLGAVLLLVLGAGALVGLALLLGGALRAEAVLAVANLVWLVLAGLGGVVVPLSRVPGWLSVLGGLTPVGALSNGLRDVLATGHPWPFGPVAVLLGWILLGWAGTVRWFKWL